MEVILCAQEGRYINYIRVDSSNNAISYESTLQPGILGVVGQR